MAEDSQQIRFSDEIEDEILIASNKFKIELPLLRALVMAESSGNPKATRFEPNYPYPFFTEKFAFDLKIDPQVELNNQKTSWGLIQCMGGLARELGFNDHLEDLVFPELGLEYGCLRLKILFSRTGYSMEDAVSAYNQGGRYKTAGGFYLNQKYVDNVMSFYRKFSSL